jgi:hypothetical protein
VGDFTGARTVIFVGFFLYSILIARRNSEAARWIGWGQGRGTYIIFLGCRIA